MRIVCLGSGNVATHLALALNHAGMEIVQVWSRDINHAAELAEMVNAKAIYALESIDKTADLYIIAVKDDVIQAITTALTGIQGLIVHTSGATSVDVLHGLTQYGVFYPLQTFSKHKQLNLIGTPFCLEASSVQAYQLLEQVATTIGAAVYKVDSAQRKTLHLAAVFACNFSNHLYDLASTILANNNLSFDLLKPLILETALKVQDTEPRDVQTGPAIRNDEQTMKDHLKLLTDRPELQHIYETMSTSIKKTRL
jgi:predicted short-subunit dehydrogenase-like oxidoreductase (DUF2520 family)